MITRFDAEYKREYPVRIMHKDELGTLRQFAAQVIDTAWFYSWYWDTKGKDWVETAKTDCASRIESVTHELKRLQAVQAMLNDIEPLAKDDDQ